MKKVITVAILAALLGAAAWGINKFTRTPSPTAVDAQAKDEITETVAYLSDLDATIAMFIIPVNFSTNGHWSGFELKASTNNFKRVVARGTSSAKEDLLFYSQSGDADTGVSGGDKMKVFVSNFEQNHERDYRSYCYITNTTTYTEWYDNAIVLVDLECLGRNPERDERGDSVWLHKINDDLVWVYGRLANDDREMNPRVPRVSLWKPIQPVRWFKKMPNWGGTFEELTREPNTVAE